MKRGDRSVWPPSLTPYELRLLDGLSVGDGARCLRCNARMRAGTRAGEVEGVCPRCSAGETVEYRWDRGS